MNRRHFLQKSGRWTALAATSSWTLPLLGGGLLSSCATIDRIFSVEKTEFNDEVIIIGGGPAGLMAALTCKRLKVPYRLFEGSHHMGGRTRSLNFLPPGKSIEGKVDASHMASVDLGVDTVDERHRRVFELCREFNIELVEKNTSSRWESALLWQGGRFLPLQKNLSELEKVFSAVTEAQLTSLGNRKIEDWEPERFTDPKVIELDQISFKKFLINKKIKLSETTADFLEGWARSNWGQGLDQVSALAVIIYVDPENRGPAQYKLRRGFGGLVHTMYERSAGVITGHLVKTGHELKEIEEDAGEFICHFNVHGIQPNAPVKSLKINCRKVIVALPVNQVSKIEWSGDLSQQMEPWKKQNHGTLNSLTRSIHPLAGNGERKQLVNKWAVSEKQIFRIETFEEENVVSVLSATKAFSPEGKDFPAIPGVTPQPVGYLDWSKQKGINGARWGQNVGNITNFRKWKSGFTSQGKISFAGEYDSTTYPGTLEAALVSGEQAVANVTGLPLKA